MIKKFFSFCKKNAYEIGALVLTLLGATTLANSVKAVADTDLTAALASSSALVTDNVGGIFTFIMTAWGKAFVIGLLLAVLALAAAIVIGAIFRRRKGKKG